MLNEGRMRGMNPSQTEIQEKRIDDLRHDLLSPLSAVFGFLELLRSGRGGELSVQQRAYVDCMGDALAEALVKINATVGELKAHGNTVAD